MSSQCGTIYSTKIPTLFKTFHRLAGLKWRNPSLKEGWVASASNFGGDPYARKGLIYKLLTTLLAKYDIPRLEYHSSAVGRFLKSGFGRFGLGQVCLQASAYLGAVSGRCNLL